jgi:hypothetical protein
VYNIFGVMETIFESIFLCWIVKFYLDRLAKLAPAYDLSRFQCQMKGDVNKFFSARALFIASILRVFTER